MKKKKKHAFISIIKKKMMNMETYKGLTNNIPYKQHTRKYVYHFTFTCTSSI